MRRTMPFIVIALAMCALSPNLSARAGITTTPTTAPAGSSPKDAVVTLFARIAAQDLPGAKAVVVQTAGVDQYLEVWIASIAPSDELAKAVRERFGEAAGDRYSEMTRFLEVFNARLQVDGRADDAATVVDPTSGMRFPMRRVDGKWKVEFPQKSAEQMDREVALNARQNELSATLAKELKAGHFHSLDELAKARDEGTMRIIDSMRPSSASSKTTTR